MDEVAAFEQDCLVLAFNLDPTRALHHKMKPRNVQELRDLKPPRGSKLSGEIQRTLQPHGIQDIAQNVHGGV